MFENLMQLLSATANPPVSDAELKSVQYELTLTPELIALYKKQNGFTSKVLQWLPVNKAVGYAGIPPGGFLALTDSNDSNPYCLFLSGPFNGYIFLLNHDGDTGLRFRSLASFVKALESLAENEIYEMEPELKNDSEPRTVQDKAALDKWRETLEETEDEEQAELLTQFAILLMGVEELGELANLLTHESTYVREVAEQRLKGLGASAAGALKDYDDEWNNFFDVSLNALIQAGLQPVDVEKYRPRSIRLEPGPVYLNMDAFFPMRKDIAKLKNTLVERARKFIAEKSKR